jgi:hypothetical protein
MFFLDLNSTLKLCGQNVDLVSNFEPVVYKITIRFHRVGEIQGGVEVDLHMF